MAPPLTPLPPSGSIPLSFSDYWVTFYDRQEYLQHNAFLPELNNEVLGVNSTTQTARMASLANVVFSEALQDTVVYPHESESFGGWAWTTGDFENATKTLYTFTDATHSPQFDGDLLGLRTRYETKRSTMLFTSFEGDHLRFTDAYWDAVILPFLQ